MKHTLLLAALLLLRALLANAVPPPPTATPKPLWRRGNEGNLTLSYTSPRLNSSSNSYTDPYDYIVHNSRLTIEFYGYWGTLTFPGLDICVRDAHTQITGKIRDGQAFVSMGAEPYVWQAGAVSLSLIPGEQLTWAKWSVVPVVMKRFAMDNQLKGMQFVLLWHGIGPVGYGQLAADGGEAPLPLENGAANAFPDPYDKVYGDTGLTIEFYGYRGVVSPFTMWDCIAAAQRDIEAHLEEGEAPWTMATRDYSYEAGGVGLWVRPEGHLTWALWAFVPAWIQNFVSQNEFKGTQFVLLLEGLGPVAFGHLVDTSRGILTVPRLDVS